MAMIEYRVCDECGSEKKRLVEIDGRIYCGRDCYLIAAKRKFDTHWFSALQPTASNSPIRYIKNAPQKIA